MLSRESRQLMERIIRREFDRQGVVNLLFLGDGEQLVRAAREMGLNLLADNLSEEISERSKLFN